MLSFFSKKKSNTRNTADDVIQGAESEQKFDEYIFIEKKSTDEPNEEQSVTYPELPKLPYPDIYPSLKPASIDATRIPSTVPYMQDVPFVLTTPSSRVNNFEEIQFQTDQILAFLTRLISLNEVDEYSFSLERSIQNNT